jgi:hypothetical protein
MKYRNFEANWKSGHLVLADISPAVDGEERSVAVLFLIDLGSEKYYGTWDFEGWVGTS